MTAYRLLSATDAHRAELAAQDLQTMNARRQQLTRHALQGISDSLDDPSSLALIFAADESILPGIVGLAAGRLCEAWYRPAVVLELGEEQSRASCRSIPEFNITAALDECADLLLRHGGHAVAAGFTVDNANIEALRQRLESLAGQALAGLDLRPRLEIDLEMDVSELNDALFCAFELLEPTGHGNPKPTLLSRQLRVLQCRRVGAEGRHLKLRLGRDAGAPLDAIGFGLGDWSAAMPQTIDAAYQLDMNEWKGRSQLQLRLLDIQPSARA